MIRIDDTLLVYDGTPRMRWAYRSSWGQWHNGDPKERGIYVNHLWPSAETGIYVRRQIAHGQKVLVIITVDDTGTVVTSSSQVPKIPSGALELPCNRDGMRSFQIGLFNWLNAADRERGLAFLSDVRINTVSAHHAVTSPACFEERLVGHDEPLRFVVQFHPLDISQLQSLISLLWDRRPHRIRRGVERLYGMDLEGEDRNAA